MLLGACCGCGLLGSYLDTPISGKYSEPVGGAVISLTEAGQEDIAFGDPIEYTERLSMSSAVTQKWNELAVDLGAS